MYVLIPGEAVANLRFQTLHFFRASSIYSLGLSSTHTLLYSKASFDNIGENSRRSMYLSIQELPWNPTSDPLGRTNARVPTG